MATPNQIEAAYRAYEEALQPGVSRLKAIAAALAAAEAAGWEPIETAPRACNPNGECIGDGPCEYTSDGRCRKGTLAASPAPEKD